MLKRYIFTTALALLGGFFLFAAEAAAQTERPADREIRYRIRFAPGKSGAVVKRRIRLGTAHVYSLRAAAGQEMTVTLTTGGDTSFTIYAPAEGIIETADGVTTWRGTLPSTGEYLIAVGTDRTADYTLTVRIR